MAIWPPTLDQMVPLELVTRTSDEGNPQELVAFKDSASVSKQENEFRCNV